MCPILAWVYTFCYGRDWVLALQSFTYRNLCFSFLWILWTLKHFFSGPKIGWLVQKFPVKWLKQLLYVICGNCCVRTVLNATAHFILCCVVLCWVPKSTNTHSRLGNTYWFSTAWMVAQMHLSVTLYMHCLSCLKMLSWIPPDHVCVMAWHWMPLIYFCFENNPNF
jgi:hypothetical protein